jgi:hypothetical protein
MDGAKEKITSIAMDYANAVTGSRLDRAGALWSYVLYLVPKLMYASPALTLTEEECNKIQSPPLMAVLPKLHLNRHTAQSIVHGPQDYGGLTLPSVYGEQSFGQLWYLLGHINLQDKTGRLMIISLSNLQLISGCEKSILQQEHSRYKGWLEKCWLTSIWPYLSRVGWKIHIRNAWLPTKPR